LVVFPVYALFYSVQKFSQRLGRTNYRWDAILVMYFVTSLNLTTLFSFINKIFGVDFISWLIFNFSSPIAVGIAFWFCSLSLVLLLFRPWQTNYESEVIQHIENFGLNRVKYIHIFSSLYFTGSVVFFFGFLPEVLF